MPVTQVGQIWEFREITESPDWNLLIMRAIKNACSKVPPQWLSGCPVIVTSFPKSHPAVLSACFENNTAISSYMETLMGFHEESYRLSHVFSCVEESF